MIQHLIKSLEENWLFLARNQQFRDTSCEEKDKEKSNIGKIFWINLNLSLSWWGSGKSMVCM